jgi:hypothetical protein
MPLWTGATIIPKKVFKTAKGFKHELKFGEDFDLWIRIAANHPVVFINKQLSYYNQDVPTSGRAVGNKLYESHEHMIFGNYESFSNDQNFKLLFEKMALYNLLDYYLKGINLKDVTRILSTIHWNLHPIKYFLYYRILPKKAVSLWLHILKLGSVIKKRLEICLYNIMDFKIVSIVRM